MEVIDIRETAAPAAGGWLKRPVLDTRSLEESVAGILAEVRKDGDKAVRKFSLRFDRVAPETLEMGLEEITAGAAGLEEGLKEAIRMAAENIRLFHSAQLRPEPVVGTMPGVRCWRKPVAIGKVGLYIPGGSAPLFSTLLILAIPARLAGCREIVLCSPPD